MKSLILCTLLVTLGMCGCSTVNVKSAQVVNVVQEHGEIAEAELLDVGIKIFNPGLENANKDEEQLVFPEIRLAEASYFPHVLMDTIQSSSAWGAVRVVPTAHQWVDVSVAGKIIQSDGQSLILDIEAFDASGRHWYTKRYTHHASVYAYKDRTKQRTDPFQNLYNEVANDLNAYRKTLSSNDRIALRKIAQLRFAADVAPTIFGQHVTEQANGTFAINRLPAENDPMIERVWQVKERDHLFVDTLQQYYDSYVKEMKRPYQQWRAESYREVIAMDKLQRQAFNEKALGALAIIAGILGVSNSNGSVRAASSLAVTGGAYVVKSGFDRQADSQIHVETLQELGDSLETSIAPHVIELEDRTVTLSGTVNNQYEQWRKILHQLYQLNTGAVATSK